MTLFILIWLTFNFPSLFVPHSVHATYPFWAFFLLLSYRAGSLLLGKGGEELHGINLHTYENSQAAKLFV